MVILFISYKVVNQLIEKEGKYIFGTVKVGEKGQIVIPKEARLLFHVEPGDTLLILGDEDTGIIVTKPEVLQKAALEIFEKMEKEDKNGA